jgi:DNA-binding NtrC family response regulator
MLEGAPKQPVGPADSVLVVTADPVLLAELQARLAQVGLTAVVHRAADSARAALPKTPWRAAVIDFGSLTASVGLDLIATLHRTAPHAAQIAVIQQPSYDLAVLAVRSGAVDVVLNNPEQIIYLARHLVALMRETQGHAERRLLLSESSKLSEELLYKLTDTARRVGELRALISNRSGSPLPPEDEQAHLLLVEEDGWLTQALPPLLPKTFTTTTVVSGGEALDHASERQFDLAVVKETLPDLPGRMVVRTLSAQAPETLVLLFAPPLNKRPGRIDRVEGGRLIPLVAELSSPAQLADRLGELYQAQLARRRERRYLAEFRAENYDLLRRFQDLRRRLREVENEHTAPTPPPFKLPT